jgi:hypothetical protein
MSEVKIATGTRTPASTTVCLPATFHALSGGRKTVSAAGDTVRAVLADLDRECPGTLERLVDAEGTMLRYVNVYLNEEDIRTLAGLDTVVRERDELWILPAVAGGSATARIED